MRVLRIYHAGRDHAQRGRERALQAAGIDVHLVVPDRWPRAVAASEAGVEPFAVVDLAVRRPADVNRHRYGVSHRSLGRLVRRIEPDVIDIHEEPFSTAAHQWLAAAGDVPVVMYTAQNVDKRYPPPFSVYEGRAYARSAALYPCSKQAAAVARGKGFRGPIEVLPLGYDPEVFRPGNQSADDHELVLALFGRLVPEKGVRDAVRILASVNASRPSRLVIVGSGPEEPAARELATALGLADRLELHPWRQERELSELARRTHFLLVPSLPTPTWTEQFGRVIVEGQASGAVVAGYRTGSIPEVAGDAGLLVEAGDVRALADAVRSLAADPAAYAVRRSRGLALAAVRTWKHVAEQHAELYASVLDGQSEPRKLPRSPRARRLIARVEFGPTAATASGLRPFALPVLRRGGVVATAAAAAIDAAAELRPALHGWRRPRPD